MTATEWLLFIVGIQIIHFLGTHRLYVKAGRKSWEAIVPIYNAIVLMQIIRRPKWWVILLFIPIINLMMFPVVWVETLRSFGKHENKDTLLGILTLGFYLFIVNYDSNTSYDKDRDLNSKTWFGIAFVDNEISDIIIAEKMQVTIARLEKVPSITNR